jgi:hypothetical protein
MAGAVLRATGSSTIRRGATPTLSASPCTRKRWSPLQTMVGGAKPSPGLSRISVAARKLAAWVLEKRTNCLGYMARDSGHSRVPEPPERMTG